MRIGYLNCIGGASGDMLLGAIVDAGFPIEELISALKKVPVEGYSISSRIGKRSGVTGTFVEVSLDNSQKIKTIHEFIDYTQASALPSKIVERACSVFRCLGEAEAKVHRGNHEEPYLHELGSLDTLIDVVGTVVGLDGLGIERLYASPLPMGSGIVRREHGLMPSFSPATAEVIAASGAPIVAQEIGSVTGEMVTPTGASLVATLSSFRQPNMRLKLVGYGLGTRDPVEYPNVVALLVGEATSDKLVANLSVLETNIDDMSPELLAYVQERLFDLGARDVWFTPIQMKKARPAVMLSAIVALDLELEAVDLILSETSTLGVRITHVTRHEAEREIVTIETIYGSIHVKIKILNGKRHSVFPEYEDCRQVALRTSKSVLDVYKILQDEASTKLLEGNDVE